MPRVSVIMAVHNGLPYLEEAVDSILNQSLRDLEFIIVEDASTDGSAEWLASLDDPRLRIVGNKWNKGLTYSLNKAIDLAQGEYVARMDSDDVSHRQRLARQTDFLDRHPEVDLLGSWARPLD